MNCPFCGSENVHAEFEPTKSGSRQAGPYSCGNCQAKQARNFDPDGVFVSYSWRAGLIVPLTPQPDVDRIDCGWNIQGIPCFMGTAEYHLRTDTRFGGPWWYVWKRSDGKFVGMKSPNTLTEAPC